MGVYSNLCTIINNKKIYLGGSVLTFLVYCGEKTCAFNKKGKCDNFKVALNEQGMCMGYSPLIMPKVVSDSGVLNNDIPITEVNHPVGFSG